VEIGIKADNMVRAARQTIEEAGPNADLSLADEVEKGILQVQAALASGDSEEIRSRTEELEKVIKALYRKTQDRKREQEQREFAKRGVEQ